MCRFISAIVRSIQCKVTERFVIMGISILGVLPTGFNVKKLRAGHCGLKYTNGNNWKKLYE